MNADAVVLFNAFALLAWTIVMIVQDVRVNRLVRELKRLRLVSVEEHNAR